MKEPIILQLECSNAVKKWINTLEVLLKKSPGQYKLRRKFFKELNRFSKKCKKFNNDEIICVHEIIDSISDYLNTIMGINEPNDSDDDGDDSHVTKEMDSGPFPIPPQVEKELAKYFTNGEIPSNVKIIAHEVRYPNFEQMASMFNATNNRKMVNFGSKVDWVKDKPMIMHFANNGIYMSETLYRYIYLSIPYYRMNNEIPDFVEVCLAKVNNDSKKIIIALPSRPSENLILRFNYDDKLKYALCEDTTYFNIQTDFSLKGKYVFRFDENTSALIAIKYDEYIKLQDDDFRDKIKSIN